MATRITTATTAWATQGARNKEEYWQRLATALYDAIGYAFKFIPWKQDGVFNG